jgi:bifunctional non-homologous end joining protein LigD
MPKKRPGKGDAPLEEYKKKRDFTATPEPSGDLGGNEKREEDRSSHSEASAINKLAFVVQKHDATRVHYDLRLEIAGVMSSWAIPRGPSYDPNVKRLAVHTEDHPMMYADFEARIPDGHYGAGDMIVWDRGTYETVTPGKEEWMRDKGHLHVRLFGEKLQGEWHLVRTKGRGDDPKDAKGNSKTWLFFKAQDKFADKKRDIVVERPESIVSGKSATRGPRRVGASKEGESARSLLTLIGDPMHASVGVLGDPSQYRYEIKYDGYRLLCAKAGDDVVLWSRRQNDWTSRFPEVAAAIAKLPAREVVVDGEACAIGEDGVPSFQKLQRWLSNERSGSSLSFAVFDLLWLDGRDLRKEPLEARRQLLEDLLKDASSPLSFAAALEGDFKVILAAAREAGLEGLVAKKKKSHYVSGTNNSWLKIKFEFRQEAAVIGYAPIEGTNSMGALVLATFDPKRDSFVYAGRVGTGFDENERRDFAKLLDENRIKKSPALDTPKSPDEVRWCEPTIVVEVGFREWTREKNLFQARYLGIREDKLPRDALREDTKLDVRSKSAQRRNERDEKEEQLETAPKMPPIVVTPPAKVQLSNPAKVLYPNDKIDKREIAEYFRAIAPFMLPHLAGRGVNMQRWPNGINEPEWFQHQAPPKLPKFVRTLKFDKREAYVLEKGRTQVERIVVDNVETLLYLANLAALTLHVTASHAPPNDQHVSEAEIASSLSQPDYVVLDLDPGEKTKHADLIQVAHAVRALADALEMQSYVKTSGKRGIHIIIPIRRGHTHDEAVRFAEHVAKAVAKVLPKIATVERMKDKRDGKLYVDFGQNGRGRTIVAPYTLRAIDGAPVSMPISWDEVDAALDPRAFNLRNAVTRAEKLGDLLAPILRGTAALPKV